MECSECKTTIDKNDTYCRKCGNKINKKTKLDKIVLSATQKIKELISVLPAISIMFEQEDEKEIPQIVVDVCGAGLETMPQKIYLYAGYFIRQSELVFIQGYKLRSQNKEVNKIINSDDEKIVKVKKIAEYLDRTEKLSLSDETIKLFLLPVDELEIVMDKVLDEVFEITKTMPNTLPSLSSEEIQEILLRNFYYGYNLRVALELIIANR